MGASVVVRISKVSRKTGGNGGDVCYPSVVWLALLTVHLVHATAPSKFDPPEKPNMTTYEMLCAIKKAADLHNVRWYSTSLVSSPRFQRHFRSCAVISSSGVLQRHHAGPEIDATEMVVRFNTAPVEGYEDIAGTRDDVRVLNNQIAGKILYNNSMSGDTFNKDGSQLQLHNGTTYVSFVGSSQEANEWSEVLSRYPYLDLHWGDYGMRIALTQVVRSIYTDSEWYSLSLEAQDWLVTVGSLGMLLALDVCDNVKAFGMAMSKEAHQWPYHYFEDHTRQWNWTADKNPRLRMFNVEKNLWRRLAEGGREEVDATDIAVVPGFSQLNCSVAIDASAPGAAANFASRHGGSVSSAPLLPLCTPVLEASKTPCVKAAEAAAESHWQWFGLGVAATVAGFLPFAICIVIGGRLWDEPERLNQQTISEDDGLHNINLVKTDPSRDNDIARNASVCRAAMPGTGGVIPGSPTLPREAEQSTASFWAAGALPVYVALLVGTDLVASATAQANGGVYPWDPVFVVLLVEVSKCLVSLLMFFGLDMHCEAPAFSEILEARRKNLVAIPVAETDVDVEAFEMVASAECRSGLDGLSLYKEAAFRLAPVAMLYAGNNCLVLFALSRIRLDAYVVWRNSAILFNAFIWSGYFRRSLKRHQFIAISSLTVGCCLSSFQANGSWNPIGLPVLLVLTSALLSALAAVLNEGVLKSERCKELGVNLLNVMLYAQTSCILCVALFSRNVTRRGSALDNPWMGLNASALGLVSMQILLGLVISRVLVHTNAVAKTMAGGVRELVTVCIAPIFVVSRFDWVSVSSVLWVFFAVMLYFIPRLLKGA